MLEQAQKLYEAQGEKTWGVYAKQLIQIISNQ